MLLRFIKQWHSNRRRHIHNYINKGKEDDYRVGYPLLQDLSYNNILSDGAMALVDVVKGWPELQELSMAIRRFIL
jgi:hypothetical protein